MSGPSWSTQLVSEVSVEQQYATSGPLLAGHWLPRSDGTGGQDDALGRAAVVRGVDEGGAGVALFGTEPLYRAHPMGMHAQVGRALYWAALAC